MLRAVASVFSVFLLFVVMAGCGGGDDTSQPVADASAAPSPAATSAAPGGPGMGGPDMDAQYDAEGEYDEAEEAMDDEAMGVDTEMAGYEGEDSSSMMMQYPGGPPPGYQGGAPGSMTADMEAQYRAQMESGGYPGGYPDGAGDEAGYDPAMAEYGGEGYDPAAMIESGYGPGGPGRPGGAPAQPQGFDGKARAAFAAGRDQEALKYLYAHALTNDEAAADLLSTIQWVPALKEPVMAVRWGVGIQLSAPANFTGDPKPIGSSQQAGGAGGYGGYGAEGGAEYGAEFAGGGASGGGGGGALTHAEVSRFAGELGDKLLAAFQARASEGKFGKVIQDAQSAAGGGQYGGAASGAEYAGAEEYGAEPGSSGPAGYPGAPGGPGGYSGGPGGYPGAPGGPGGYPGGRGGPGGGASGGSPIAPGLTFVGIGSEKDLMQKATEQGVDLLLVLDVELKLNVRTRQIINEAAALVCDPTKTGRDAVLVRTKPLNNLKVQFARQQNKDDGLEKEIEKIVEFIDKSAVMVPLPEGLNEENVQGRVSFLVNGKHADPLPVLAEIKFWNRKGLLSDAAMQEAFQQVVGAEAGATLATGSEDERKETVKTWLPEKAA